jgi:predicted transcriptional regulator
MITREEDIDAHALHRQGWTISAIARHLGRDRKTIRAYLRGGREAGVGPRPRQIRSGRSPRTARPGWARTRTCGRPPCSTK